MPKTMQTWLARVGVIATLSTLAACWGSDGSSDDASQTQTSDVAAESSAAPNAPDAGAPPEPDVADIPDVVADVNGEKITRDDFIEAYQGQFQQMAAQSQATGQEVDQDALKKEVVDNLVSNALLIQAADKAKISPSAKEVEATLQELATGNGVETTQEFLSVLKEQGFSEQEARGAVSDQLKVDQFITDEAAIEEPTKQELRELYDSLTQQQAGGGAESGGGPQVPPFEEVKQQLAEQLQQEKESEAIGGLLNDLQAKADITLNL